jgi:hypothetical protein
MNGCMEERNVAKHRIRRWFQLSLKSLFLLTLLVATFFAGYSLATKQAEAERLRAEEEARLKAEATLQRPNDWVGTKGQDTWGNNSALSSDLAGKVVP